MDIRIVEENKDLVVDPILRSLPEWFGIEDFTQAYIKGVKDKPLLVAFDGNRAIGFVSLKKHFEQSYEVYVMGIYPTYHRKGIGKSLVSRAEEYLKEIGADFLQVKTLSEANSDKNYAKTRSFYLSCGFLPVEEFKTLWDEWNPCLLMIKKLK